jgi:hypothetical protein
VIDSMRLLDSFENTKELRMKELKRTDKPENGWTVDFDLLLKIRNQAEETGEYLSVEQVEAAVLAMVDLGYAVISESNDKAQILSEAK